MSKPQEDQTRVKRLDRWIKAGLGSLPLPETPEEFAQLSVTDRMALEKSDPEFYEELSGPPLPLPAEVEKRLMNAEMDFNDIEPLERSGYLVAASQLREARRQAMWRTFEENHNAQMQEIESTREQREAEAEASRIQSMQVMEARLKAEYLTRIHAGQPA